MDGRQIADQDEHIGTPARLAGRYRHRALVGEQRRLGMRGACIDEVDCRTDSLGEHDRGAHAVDIRIQGEDRALARIEQLRRVLRGVLKLRLPVADPSNRHSHAIFPVPREL